MPSLRSLVCIGTMAVAASACGDPDVSCDETCNHIWQLCGASGPTNLECMAVCKAAPDSERVCAQNASTCDVVSSVCGLDFSGSCVCDVSNGCDSGCSCDLDCAVPFCGDGNCDAGEDSQNCALDCNTTCYCDTTAGCEAGCACDSDCLCDDTCEYASDGACDDGGPGSEYSACTYGTDCTDCGPRDPDVACPCDTGVGCQTGCACDSDCTGGQFHDPCDCPSMTSQDVGICSTCNYPLECFWSYGDGFCTKQCDGTADCADYANTECAGYSDDIPGEWWHVCDY
jgi:hypothetical protein